MTNKLQGPRYVNKKQATTKREGGYRPKSSPTSKTKEMGTKSP
jgi:hypothetical protein